MRGWPAALLVAWLACASLTVSASRRPSAADASSEPQAQANLAESPRPAAGSKRPKVRLVATGGTISNRTGGRLTSADLLRSIPNLDRYVEARAEQFANVSSGELTLGQWLELSRRINRLFSDEPDLEGIVVTSGTDTLEEIAYFLHLTVRTDRPVVVVGSMRNPSTIGYEGAANLLEAFRVAGDPASRGKGTLVVMNDRIASARDVTKTDAVHLEAFQSREYGVLGFVDADRVVFYRNLLARHTAASEFDVSGVAALPRVDVLLVYQGASGDLLKAAADSGARGIVIAGAGAGSLSGTQAEGVDYALDKGVFVVTGTRTGSGRIAPPPKGPRELEARDPGERERKRQPFRIYAEDLPPLKARVLLMLALSTTTNGPEIQRMFTEY